MIIKDTKDCMFYVPCLRGMSRIGKVTGGTKDNESTCQCRDAGSFPGSGRCLGEGNGNLFQYSCPWIPWTEVSDGLQSVGLQRVRHDWTHTCRDRKYISNWLGNGGWLEGEEGMGVGDNGWVSFQRGEIF